MESVCYKIIIRERKNQSIIRINSADNKSNEPEEIREIGEIRVGEIIHPWEKDSSVRIRENHGSPR